MTYDPVKRLRSQIGDDLQEVYSLEALFRLAADKIEQLTAERDHAWEMAAKADTQMGQSLADNLQAKVENDRLRDALTRLLEPFGDDPCYYDHHGYCQAHFVESGCCVAYGRRVLKGETT